jgi:uncharacterized protein (TIGR03437 family)
MRVPALLLAITAILAFTAIAAAQNPPDWRKVGGFSVNLALASPATGGVEQVWFSPGGSTLFARTQSGKLFETADFVSWSPVTDPVDAPAVTPAAAVRLPETGAAIVAVNDPTSIFGLGRQVSRSQDGGRTWVNLTGYHGRAVIGPTQHSVAVSPVDPDQLVVANDYGVWRSLDGGATWAGLNQNLPNLSVEHIVSTPTGVAGTRIQATGLGETNLAELELPPGSAVWQVAMANDVAADAANKDRYSRTLGTKILSVASSKSMLYAGSADGRIFVSQDGVFGDPYQAGGPVESIFSDPAEPNVAVAAVAGNGAHVLRTVDSGLNWDQLDSPTLPGAPAHGITADLASNSIYVATDKGVFYGHADLHAAASNPVSWQNLTAKLNSAAARDVRLDPAGVQLYIALDGYGVYAAAAPHSRSTFRIVDAADSTVRPAAPGSLLSVLGANVSSATGGSLAYPVLTAKDAESQIQVPFGAEGPNVTLSLNTTTGLMTTSLAVQPVSPAILVGRSGVPVLYDADTSLPLDLRNAAHSNGRVGVMMTGLGRVRPDWPAGVPAPENAPEVAAPMQAFLDGAPVQVTRATLAPTYVGFYLVELQLPAITNAGMSELHLTADGHESNKVQIWIEP